MPQTPSLRAPTVATLALAALTGCMTMDDAPPASAEPQQAQGNCPIMESRDWAAWVNAMPGPSATKELIVTGQVTVPTPGFTIALTAGMADRSATPIQQLILTATPPGSMVPQVLTTMPVRYQGPAISMQYRGVRVMCGGQMLTEITDVPVAR